MHVQRPRCALTVDSRRWMMRRVNMSWTSALKIGGGFVFFAGGRVDDGGCLLVLEFPFWSLLSCVVILMLSRDLRITRDVLCFE